VNIVISYYSVHNRQAEYCDKCVCQSACPRAYFRNHMSKLQQIFSGHGRVMML